MKITSKQLRQIIREEVQRINEAKSGTSDVKVKIVASGFEMFGKTRVDVKVINIKTSEITSSKGFDDPDKAAEHIEALFKKHPNHTYEVDTKSDTIRKALPKPKP
tara:strand:- start:1266 stop:1580 length:315 start_codon:yes stop_codon:yes gene_type:complete